MRRLDALSIHLPLFIVTRFYTTGIMTIKENCGKVRYKEKKIRWIIGRAPGKDIRIMFTLRIANYLIELINAKIEKTLNMTSNKAVLDDKNGQGLIALPANKRAIQSLVEKVSETASDNVNETAKLVMNDKISDRYDRTCFLFASE